MTIEIEELLARFQANRISQAEIETQILRALFSQQLPSGTVSSAVNADAGSGPDDYPYDGTWRSKMLYILEEHAEEGMQRAEILRTLRSRHKGKWSEPAVDAQMAHMEKEGKVRVVRNNGRNTYFLA